jgi:hypothetical protein
MVSRGFLLVLNEKIDGCTICKKKTKKKKKKKNKKVSLEAMG